MLEIARLENNKLSKEELIVLKNILNPLEYFLLSVLYFSSNKKDIKTISKLFYVDQSKIETIINKTFLKIKDYQNQDKYLNKLMEIEAKEQANFKKLNIKPLSPLDIIKFLYLKSHLTNKEQELYKLNILSNYNLTKEDYAKKLNISLAELDKLVNSLKVKIKNRFKNTTRFIHYRNLLLKKYSLKIYSLYQDESFNKINYQDLYNTYKSYSLEEILSLANSLNYKLNKKEKSLLKKYFGRNDNHNKVIKNLNNIKNILRSQIPRLSLDKLYETFLNNQEAFTPEAKDYLLCYVFKCKDKYEYREKRFSKKQLLDKLELLYYNANDLFNLEFSKDQYLEIRDELDNYKRYLLDMYFGVYCNIHSIKEISNVIGKDLSSTNSDIQIARLRAIIIYGGREKVDRKNNKKIYLPYLRNNIYHLDNETYRILRLFYVDNQSIDEIAKQFNYSKKKISNIISYGIRKIDYYRFGIMKNDNIDETTLKKYLNNHQNLYSKLDIQIINLRFTKLMSNKEISASLNIPYNIVTQTINKFKKYYFEYQIKDVDINMEDLKIELLRHPIESVLSLEEKENISLLYGFKNNFNKEGIILTEKELSIRKSLSPSKYHLYLKKIIDKIKARKIHILEPELSYFKREELERLLNDKHLPLSNKNYNILCYMFGLNGKTYLPISSIASLYNCKVDDIKTIYYLSLITIKKYELKEIEGKISSSEIKSFLKYIPQEKRNIIIDYFINELSISSLSKEDNIGESQIERIIFTFKLKITSYLNNQPNLKLFNYDYFEEAIKNTQLPFYGDLSLAIKIFKLLSNNESIPSIKEKLNLNISIKKISEIINDLILSVYKLQDGIIKTSPLLDKLYNMNIENLNIKDLELILQNFNNLDPNIQKSLINIINILKNNSLTSKEKNKVIRILSRLDKQKKLNNYPILKHTN